MHLLVFEDDDALWDEDLPDPKLRMAWLLRFLLRERLGGFSTAGAIAVSAACASPVPVASKLSRTQSFLKCWMHHLHDWLPVNDRLRCLLSPEVHVCDARSVESWPDPDCDHMETVVVILS